MAKKHVSRFCCFATETRLCHHFFLLLVPEHFQFSLLRRKGLFGSLAAFGKSFIWPAERAQ
jgi:hypothetical protein